MRKDFLFNQTVYLAFLLAVTLLFSVLFMSNHVSVPTCNTEKSSQSLSFTKKDDTTRGIFESECKEPSCMPSQMQDIDIIYKPLMSCIVPQFLPNYSNPCWKATNKAGTVTCSATIMLLGFPKCGTGKIEQWFANHDSVTTASGNYFFEEQLSDECPNKWLQQHPRGKRYITNATKLGYVTCKGCALINKVINTSETFIMRRSAIQYLQYTMVPQSRYIISMRNPTERMFSNYFYLYSRNPGYYPYIGFTMDHIGHSYFHNMVLQAVTNLQACLQQHGTSACILHPELFTSEEHKSLLTHMITIGCYVTHIREVLRFIPQEAIYFSKLEEFSKDKTEAMRQIFRFVGLPEPKLTDATKSDLLGTTVNKGYENKPVDGTTKDLLYRFYQPFNSELSELLGDPKWLWK